MLKFVDRLRRFHREILHGIDIAEPIGALDGVLEMPLPAVRRHIGQGCGNPTLRGDGMRTRREDLGDAGCLEALLCHAERRPEACTARADNADIVGMINECMGLAGLCEGSRSEESSVGREGVSTCRTRWEQCHY